MPIELDDNHQLDFVLMIHLVIVGLCLIDIAASFSEHLMDS